MNQHATHFLTFTVIDWIDLFTRSEYFLIFIDSLNYCVQKKNLEIFGWIIMPSHVHLLCCVNEPFKLSDVIRDLKKHVSKSIIKTIHECAESRRDWLLARFEAEAKRTGRAENYKIWKDDNHAIEIGDFIDIEQKLNYIHENPVKALMVHHADAYYFSSAIDYTDSKGLVTISKI